MWDNFGEGRILDVIDGSTRTLCLCLGVCVWVGVCGVCVCGGVYVCVCGLRLTDQEAGM